MWLWFLLALVVVVALMWAYFTAQRLNRLHIRTDAARWALEAALYRRAGVLAALRPSASEVAVGVEALRLSPRGLGERAAAERRVEEEIALIDDPPAILVDATTRVRLAQRFYNEAVADTRALRLRPVVRACRLAGSAPLPEFFEISGG